MSIIVLYPVCSFLYLLLFAEENFENIKPDTGVLIISNNSLRVTPPHMYARKQQGVGFLAYTWLLIVCPSTMRNITTFFACFVARS